MTWENLSSHSLNKLVSGIYKKSERDDRRNLLVDQYPEIKGKCATPIVRMAIAYQDLLDEENRFILYRPDDPSYIRYYAPDGSVPWTYDTPEGHFKIHYSETGTDAVYGSDGIQSTIPDYVVSFGSYFEQAWYYETDPNKFGYDPPPPDENNGGDNRFDVYIKSISYYGYTQIEKGHPYIVVHNNYTSGFESNLDPEGPRAGNMKITAAHEFFHAIQYYYDDWNNDCIWWEENTAVWMEDEVFDPVDGYLNYLGNPFDDLNGNLRWDIGETWYEYNGDPGGIEGRDDNVWFEAPHISLDTMFSSVFSRYEYGGVMWAKYLAARFGNEFIKDSFIITDYNTDALPAIKQTLLDYGSSLEEAFADFRVKVLTLDPNIFKEGQKYPLVRHEGNYGYYPISLNLGQDISHLSCCYIGLKPPAGKMNLVIEVDGQDYSNFGIAIVLFKDTGYEVRDIPIENWDEQVGGIEIESFGTEGLYKRATIIPLNLSSYQDYRSLVIDISTKVNSPPVGLSVQLTPDPAYVNDELLCTASGVTDADGDIISYKYVWKKDGIIDKETDFVENKTTDTLDPNRTSQGETWSCEVTVKDPSDAQDSATSKLVLIDNRKPIINTVPDGPHIWSEMGYMSYISLPAIRMGIILHWR